MPTRQRYRVLIPSGIEYPTDQAIIRAIEAGENLGLGERKHKRAEPGDVVDDLPRKSIPVLLRKKWIEHVADEPIAQSQHEVTHEV